jgi:hypothetical protein
VNFFDEHVSPTWQLGGYGFIFLFVLVMTPETQIVLSRFQSHPKVISQFLRPNSDNWQIPFLKFSINCYFSVNFHSFLSEGEAKTVLTLTA